MIGLRIAASFLALAGLAWVALSVLRGLRGRASGSTSKRAALLGGYAVLVSGVLVALHRGGLYGLRASPELAFGIHDLGTRLLSSPFDLVLPGSTWLGGAVGGALQSFVEHAALSGALIAFGLAYLCWSSLFGFTRAGPGGTLCLGGRVLSLCWVLGVALSKDAGGALALGGEWAVVVLTPIVAAECLHAVVALARSARAPGALWTIGYSGLLASPELALWTAAAGVVLVWVRALIVLEPTLARTPEPGPSRRRLGLAACFLAIAAGALTLLDHAALAKASPLVGAGPSLCAGVERAPLASNEVAFSTETERFVVDKDESRSASPIHTRADAEKLCAERGKRLCTSDEWYVACLCTYPQDSAQGPQWRENHLLARTVEREAAKQGVERRDVSGLLEGRSEVVSGAGEGKIFIAGARDGAANHWTTDCRYRARVTERSLGENTWGFIGARCCR